MRLLALSDGVVIAWWVALGVGLVVALVVWALLEALRRTVNAIDKGVNAVWTMGKRVAQNTQTTYLFGTTKARGLDLLAELRQHAALAERSRR
jgi:type II secretory pathway component PulF